ncbi:formate transporter FocA [Shewanella sp.]|nr:formate transporter FocA [Shewanella sp.]
MYQQAARYGADKVLKAQWQSFGLAIFAGAFIALAFVFYITVTTGSHGSWGVMRFAGGLAFSLGLMLVVICGGELFTSTVLSSVAWAQKHVSAQSLLKCWGRVYVGNFIGAMLMLLLIMVAGMHNLNEGQWGLNALSIAEHKLHHSWWQAFVLGVLCNVLVCLGVWMTFSSKEALTKAILLMLPVAMFVSSGFEHSIANLFMVPLGIVIVNMSDPVWFAALNVTQGQFSDLTVMNFIINNLIPVTLGNIVGGGLFVGLGYWLIEQANCSECLHLTPQNKHAVLADVIALSAFEKNNHPSFVEHAFAEPSLTQSLKSAHLSSGVSNMPKTIQTLSVRDLMNTTPLTLNADMTIYAALQLLSDSARRSAPVINKQQQLLGFISEQDLLRSLWSQEFAQDTSAKVADLMQTQVLTVSPSDRVADLLALMVVDKEALFPVNDMGMLMGSAFYSYEERLRAAKASQPSVFPVIEDGVLCGVITRQEIAHKVCELHQC